MNIYFFSNAYHTLFVGRLAYDMTEKKLRREFEQYGNINLVRLVTDLSGKPRGKEDCNSRNRLFPST